jgi:flagellin
MAIYFSTNVPELKSMYSFNRASDQIAKSSIRLATGLRVNTGADDATGFKVREGLRADIKTIEAVAGGVRKAENVLEIAQSSIGQALEVLRGDPDDKNSQGIMGFLASITPENDKLSTKDKAAYDDYIKNFQSSLGGALYDGTSLFASGGSSFNLTVGKDANAALQSLTIDTTEYGGVSMADFAALVAGTANVDALKANVEAAIASLSEESGRLGYKQDAVSSAKNAFAQQTTSLKSAEANISSVDAAVEGSNLARAELIAQNSMNVMQYSRSFASFVATSAFG